ncbi:MAG: aspartyl protease family protein [Candidatus Baltobacteraceae bacterium]
MKAFCVPAALLALALCAGASASAGSASGDRVTQLLNVSRAALGGAAIGSVKIVRLDAKVTGAGLSGTGTSWQEIGGRRFAETYAMEPLTGGDGFDGNDVWNEDASGLVWVDGGLSGRTQEISTAFAGNYALWAPGRGGATVTWGGPKTAKGQTFDSLNVRAPGTSAPFELWFDRESHLPVRFAQRIGARSSITTYSDYRANGGLMLPYFTHTESNDGNSSDTSVTSVAINPPDGDARLAKPLSNVHDFSIADGALQTSVPFDLVENHVYLDVMLNGKGPYRFIYDTGGANIVDPEVAREIGAPGKGAAQGSGVGASTESFSFAPVDTLSIGEATIKHQIFAVAPVRAGFGVSGGRPVDGLIGFEVLSRFVTTFDYANDRVELRLPSSAAQPPADADVLPFVLDGRQPQFACSIDGIATQCTLDTGARNSISLFGPFMAEHPQVVPSPLTAEGVNGFGFGGPAMGRLGRLASLGIGKFSMPDVIADITSQTQGAFAQPYVAANVGGNLFKRFTLTLDYDKHTMALTPNASLSDRESYERSGLFLLNKAGKKIVYNVRPGTPAETAGLAKGDVIDSIDGKDAAAMSLADVRDMFSAAAGTVVHLQLTTKEGAPKTAMLTLKDYV